MGRILAVDYGSKRVGLAETDDLQMIASPLDTIHSTKVVAFIVDYCSKYDVKEIVVGEPKTLDNKATDATKMINEFCVHLKKKLPGVELLRVDERFTSKMAKGILLESGLSKSKRADKSRVDAISASLILESYLSQKSGV